MQELNKIVLIGGGGHCCSVIDVIEEENKFIIAGIVDKPELLGNKINDYKFIATDSDLPRLIQEFEYFFITIGHIESNKIRVKMFDKIVSAGGKIPTIISPYSYVSKRAKLQDGTIVMHHAFVNANAFVGKNSIINTGSIIEHDANVGDNCHISTGALVNGNCSIKNDCFIGSGSVLMQGIVVGQGSLVGAGSIVLKDVTALSKVAGNPSRLI